MPHGWAGRKSSTECMIVVATAPPPNTSVMVAIAKMKADLDSLHDVGDHQCAMFLVTEHLSGLTLAERLQKGRRHWSRR